LRLSALAEFANHAFGIRVINAHVLADLRLPIKEIFGMSDSGSGRLALDKVMLGLADNRATIRATVCLRGERFGGIAKHLRGDRFGLC